MPENTTQLRPHVVRVRVSDDERAFLEKVSFEDGRTVSNVLRLALKEFYDRWMEQEDAA